MKIKLGLLITILLLGTSLQVQAQAQPAEPPARTLSPDEAVEIAIRNNLGLQAARVDTGTRRRASDLSWNQFVPDINLLGTLNRQNQQLMTIPGISQWTAIGTIQTSINLSVAMIENTNRLRLDYQAGLVSYNRARQQLERDIRQAYNNMLLFQENIEMLRESFEATERAMNFAYANFLAGLAPELPFLQAQVAMENMRPAVEQVEYVFRLSKASFAMLLGLPYDTDFELVPLPLPANGTFTQFTPLDASQMAARAAVARPEVQEIRQGILQLESARTMQTRALFPTLSLSWAYSPMNTDPWNNSWLARDNWTDQQGAFSVTLGLRLHSLFPFSQDTQAIRNTDDQITTASIGLAQMIQGTELEIHNIMLSLDRIRRTADAQAQTLALAERVFLLTEQAFAAGLQDLLQVQNAQLELRQAQVSLLEQQFNYLNGLLDLEYLIGVPFGTLSSPE
ncbi:MAG: TolC family protein [Spirochaetes bacterium]|nr:TolC family protein [Spirochaetota bacterium]